MINVEEVETPRADACLIIALSSRTKQTQGRNEMKKHKTNIQMIKHLMEFSRHGALMQAFIMDALDKQSKAIAKMDPAEIDTGGFINGEAWINCAKELQEALDEHFTQ
jgi:hypothetical protein